MSLFEPIQRTFDAFLKASKTQFDAYDNGDYSQWPESWKSEEYFDYGRFVTTLLPSPQHVGVEEVTLVTALESRSSFGYAESKVIDEIELSVLLQHGIGKKKSGGRMYPSGGGRYPLEHFVILSTDVGSIKKGVYHYNVAVHGLTALPFANMDSTQVLGPISQQAYKDASPVCIVTVCALERSARKYKDLSFKYAYIEAGAAMQNILLLASSMRVSASIINHNDIRLEALLAIDGVHEYVVGTVVIGFKQ